MKAPAVQLDERRLTLHVRLDVVNSAATAWTSEAGYAVGSQIYDPETDALVVEGRREPLKKPLAPGESVEVDLDVELPTAPGRYRIFISPMQEDVGWLHEQGAPFLVVDTEVAAGRARLICAEMTRRSALRRRRFVRSVGRAFEYPLTLIWRNRSLIRSMVQRDIHGRYRGSFVGLFWTVLNPLLLMATYFFVFGIVLRARFQNDPSRSGFVLYFLAGMLPWLAFSEAAGRAPFVLLEYRNLVKKLVFPLEILPVNLGVAGLVTELFALGIFLIGLFGARGSVPATALWLPVLLVPQLLFTLGLCWILAALGAYVRDLGQVIGFLLTLWFFITPICYPAESMPAWALSALSANPIFMLVSGYRQIFLDARAPAFGPLWKFWAIAAALFIFGHAWFYKLKRGFADVI